MFNGLSLVATVIVAFVPDNPYLPPDVAPDG